MQLMLLEDTLKTSYPIYILLTDTNSNFSKVEKWFLNTSFSHASLSFDRGLKKLYAFNDDGFVEEDIQKSELLYNADYSIYRLDVTRNEWMKIQEAMKRFLDDPKKFKYSNEGLIRLILGKPKEYDYKYFCSEFIAHIINAGNTKYLNGTPQGFVAPEDFAHNRYFKLIEKGTKLGKKYPK